MSIGNNIRRIRKEKKMPIRELVNISDVGKSTISDIENDNVSPTVATLKKLAAALDVSVDEFFKEDIENNSTDNDDLTKRDKRDIAKDLNGIMKKLEQEEDGPIYYNGNELEEEDKELFRDALELALKTIKIKNKDKYTPKKYKK